MASLASGVSTWITNSTFFCNAVAFLDDFPMLPFASHASRAERCVGWLILYKDSSRRFAPDAETAVPEATMGGGRRCCDA